jgi:hypothetical protein
MILAWVGILSIIIGLSAVYGGQNCEVPKSGMFHLLLQGHKYVRARAGRFACREVTWPLSRRG